MKTVVVDLDQRSSRRQPDRVPQLLDRLGPVHALRGFERTAGDEVQGVLDDPHAVVACLETVLGEDWHVGLGIGVVETPLPAETRAGRGPAFLHAREAVEHAKRSTPRLRVVGDDPYRAEQLETVLWLWSDVVTRRTPRGWEVTDLVSSGLTHAETADRLGVSQSAVSQRARAAGLVAGRRAARLVAQLVAEQLR